MPDEEDTIEINQQEASDIIRLVDVAVREGGLNTAYQAFDIVEKLRAILPSEEELDNQNQDEEA